MSKYFNTRVLQILGYTLLALLALSVVIFLLSPVLAVAIAFLVGVATVLVVQGAWSYFKSSFKSRFTNFTQDGENSKSRKSRQIPDSEFIDL